MKSIMQSKKECFICGYQRDLELHHCIHGTSNRKNADKYGLTVWLCVAHHREGHQAAHKNSEVDMYLKQCAQKSFERVHGDRDLFRQIFGKSFL